MWRAATLKINLGVFLWSGPKRGGCSRASYQAALLLLVFPTLTWSRPRDVWVAPSPPCLVDPPSHLLGNCNGVSARRRRGRVAMKMSERGAAHALLVYDLTLSLPYSPSSRAFSPPAAGWSVPSPNLAFFSPMILPHATGNRFSIFLGLHRRGVNSCSWNWEFLHEIWHRYV